MSGLTSPRPMLDLYTLQQRTLIRNWLKSLRNFSRYNVFQGYLSFVRKLYGCRFRTRLGDKAVSFEEKAVVVALSKSVLFFLKNM